MESNLNQGSQTSDVAEAKTVLAQQHTDGVESDHQTQNNELEYDEPRCGWSPGEEAEDCGEGIICPPCS